MKSTNKQMHSSSRRRTLCRLAALGAFGPAGLSALVQHALAKGDLSAVQGLYDVSGRVRVNGQPAKAGTRIKPGDKVVTEDGSHAVVVVGQDAFLLRAGTNVTLVSDAKRTGVLATIVLTTGKMLAVFGKREDDGISINVPNATVGIRGTGAYFEIHEGRSYFCLCYGKAALDGKGLKQSKQFSTQHHESPVWLDDRSGGLKIEPAPMLDHTDAELIMLEKLNGREPPFVAQGLTGRY
jgi:hypothetical protein